MRIDRGIKRVDFEGEDGDTLSVHYDNRGDPYRQGVTLDLRNADTQDSVGVFLESREACELRDLLNRLYPIV
jgi:hypothetical protein